MLVLSRKIGEKLFIGDNIVVSICRISGNRVTVGIEAPTAIKVIRGELPVFRGTTPPGHDEEESGR